MTPWGGVYCKALPIKFVNTLTNCSQFPVSVNQFSNNSGLTSVNAESTKFKPRLICFSLATNCCSSTTSINKASRGQDENKSVFIPLSCLAKNSKSLTNFPNLCVSRSTTFNCCLYWTVFFSSSPISKSAKAICTLVWIKAIGLLNSWEASAVNCFKRW